MTATQPQPSPWADSLVGRLTAVQNNFVLGLASISLLANSEARKLLRPAEATFGGHEVKLEQVSALLDHPLARDESLKQFAIMLLMDLVTKGFQLLEARSGELKKMHALRNEPFYDFARVIRNAMSHDFAIQYTDNDRARLPLRWRDRALTADMHGNPVPLEFFGWVQGWAMFSDYIDFARRLDGEAGVVPYPSLPVSGVARDK